MPNVKRRRSGGSRRSSVSLLKRACLKNVADSDSPMETPRTLLMNMGVASKSHVLLDN